MAGTSTRENGLKETITLKWCTPRTNSIGGQSQGFQALNKGNKKKSSKNLILIG